MNTNSKLFLACCLSLLVTSLTFGVRAGIMDELGASYNFTREELGWITAMAFYGFPIAMLIGGVIYNQVGAKFLMVVAFVGHLLGLALTILADGFWGLMISTFCVGFANGSVEAACNPLIADIYHKNKTTMLNRFHVWFPGGIVIGSLMSAGMTELGLGWELQIAMLIIPTLAYGYLVFTVKFPEPEHTERSTITNIKSLVNPLFILVLVCMSLTATTEFGTSQWAGPILSESGAHPMVVLALITGLMAVGRYFAGPLVHKLNPAGVLLASSAVATIGIYLMSSATGGMVYLTAILFALGVTYFWPTMIGFVSEYLPKTGALGMSLVGGVGMFAFGWWSPVIGGWLDKAEADALLAGVAPEAANLAAGQATLSNLAIFPAVLIVLFAVMYFWTKKIEK
ncbi:MAG: MFS family permease [Flavobacteriales bacterium]|jgi:MFS family permease